MPGGQMVRVYLIAGNGVGESQPSEMVELAVL